MSASSIEEALSQFSEAARRKLTVPMLRTYGKWLAGNRACVSAALRAECQTLLSDIYLEHGPVTKVGYSPDGRRPLNTTYHMVPLSGAALAFIVRNVKKIGEMQYAFLTEASPELSGEPTERLIDVPNAVQPQDVVIAIERTRMYKRRPASLGVKILIGNIDHDQNLINVEREIPLFAETLSAATVAVPVRPEAATIIVPITSKKKKGPDDSR